MGPLMDITWERVDGVGIVQTSMSDGEKFYNLADVMNVLGLKPSWKNGIEKQPTILSCRIVWGLRCVDGNFIESAFIDQAGLDDLVSQSKE